MDRSTTFGQKLYDFIWERYGECYSNLSQTPEYKDNKDKAEATLKEITKLLGPEHQNLIDAYVEAQGDCFAFDIHQSYLIGFNDSMELKNTLASAVRR